MHISELYPGFPDPPYQTQTGIQKLSPEGQRVRVHISECWPGAPDPPFPNKNSCSNPYFQGGGTQMIIMHVLGCWPGVPDPPFPNANS